MEIGVIDFLIAGTIVLVAWCVAAEGAFGAGTIFIGVVVSGLLAMNFFEPLADRLDNIALIGPKADMLALLGLFAALLTGIRVLCEKLSPTYISLQGVAHDIGRWGFGALTGYVTAGILLTALHTSPLPREFIGFTPDRPNLLFNVASPDREWLGFTQYVTERPFSRTQIIPDTDPQVGNVPVKRIFDGRTAYHWGLDDFGAARVLQEANATVATPDNRRKLALAATEIVMPSFIVRYADRRGQLNGGAAPATEPAPAEGTAPPSGPNF